MRDQLIVGLRAYEIRKELLRLPNLTLADAMAKAVALEASIADSTLYENSSLAAPNVVNRVASDGKGKVPTCRYCGRSHKRGKEHCLAAEAQCSHCKKIGHFAAVFLQKRKSQMRAPVAHAVEEQKSMQPVEELNAVYDAVYVVQGSVQKSKDFTITLKVNGTACRGLLDTGATRTLVTEDLVLATRPSPTTLRAYDGKKVETVGVAEATIQAGDQSCNCTCFVVPVGRPVLFGRYVINQLQLLTQADVNMVKVEPIDIS